MQLELERTLLNRDMLWARRDRGTRTDWNRSNCTLGRALVLHWVDELLQNEYDEASEKEDCWNGASQHRACLGPRDRRPSLADVKQHAATRLTYGTSVCKVAR